MRGVYLATDLLRSAEALRDPNLLKDLGRALLPASTIPLPKSIISTTMLAEAPMKHFLFAAAVLILSSLTFAQDANPAGVPASREDVQKLFDVMQVRQQMRLTLDVVMKQQREMVHETLKRNDPTITEARLTNYDNEMDAMLKDMPVDGMLDDMIPIYQKHFNNTDIAAMTTFYASPTGQKALHEMPALTSESMQASYGRMQKQMDAVMQKVKRMAADDRAKEKKAAANKSGTQQ